MRKLFSISILLTILFPALASAQALDAEGKLKIFSDACLNRWMQDAPATQDTTAIKALGQRFCTCAGKRIIAIMENPKTSATEMDSAKKEASQACLMESILQETANTFTITTSLTDQKLEMACNKTWTAVFPKGMTESQKLYTGNFCHCASTPLTDLARQKSKLTDAQYNDKLANIATTCKK